jgi:hypothetical protein
MRPRSCAAVSRLLYLDTLDHIAELASRWRDDGHLPASADTRSAAATLLSLMQGLIVMQHLVDDVPVHALRSGLSVLGTAVGPTTTIPAIPEASP